MPTVPRSSERVLTHLTRGALALAVLVLGAGCPPTCQQVCSKLDRCGFDGSVPRAECQLSCERQLSAFRDDDDDDGLANFNDLRRCIGGNSCDSIDEGVCFDDALFAIEAP